MPQGSFHVWIANSEGRAINYVQGGTPDLLAKDAVDIYLGPDAQGAQPPPKDQMELQADINGVLRALRLIYKSDGATERDNRQFRNYYVRIFQVAQLGLEGPNAGTELARSALTTITNELIDDEAGRVKNDHLIKLAEAAKYPAAVAIAAYLLVRTFWDWQYFPTLGIDPQMFANFFLLWAGCFLGVWLSYAIRTTIFSLRDLTITDNDRLLPHIRLYYAGLLTMILGMLFMTGTIDVQLGAIKVGDIKTFPMLAFLVGTFCGISEQTLSTKVAKRVTDLFDAIK